MKIVSVRAVTHGRVAVEEPSTPAAGMLVGFHGYMENAELQLARLRQIPGAERWLLVSIQALHRFYRGSQAVVASWMTRQDREEAIEDNIAYVDAAVHTLRPSGDSPIVCLGFSQGAAMAFRASVRGRFDAAGIVSVGADVPPELLTGSDAPHGQFPRVLFARGVRDEWLTAEVFDRDLAALRALAVDVRPLVYDGAHEWTAEVARAIGEFIGAER